MKSMHVNYLAAALLLASSQQAFAAGPLAGTDAGATISNTATVDYTVGGVNQDDVSSNTVEFLVDRLINLTVAEVGGTYTDVAPGSSDQYLTYTVTNNTNNTQDIRLSAADGIDPFGGTDDFNPTNIRVFVESGATPGYQPLEDTALFIDELAADGTVTVYVVANIPLGQADGNTAAITLTGIAAEAGTGGTLGGDSTETAGENTALVDTVFGDAQGDTDAAEDGRHSDTDAYRIASAAITVLKSFKIISDPFNGITDPKAIPGAVIEYCIQVTNGGGTAASGVEVSDPIPANTTYVAGSIFAGGVVSGGDCSGGTAEDDDSIGADETELNGGNFTSNTVRTTVPSVGASVTTTSRFRVTVN